MYYKDLHENPYHEYKGDIVKYVVMGRKRVLVTQEKTVNKKIDLINVYINGKRVRGVRYNKDSITFMLVNDVLISIYWDFIYGK